MDISSPVPKDQHCLECVDVIDRISKLPDEILGKILSYLPTKQAVATTVLSKRWEHLRTLTTDLYFCDDWLHRYHVENNNENDCMIKWRSFQNYLDRLIFYHGRSNIRSCHMFFQTKYAASIVYAWIYAVITCNVRELYLYFLQQNDIYQQLPWMLFSSNRLVVLTIVGKFVLDMPRYVSFPCLKLLQIQFAVFVDDASTERLFSSCQVLEHLSIGSFMDCLQIMNISVPSLKQLCIELKSSAIQTNINTPCLEYLEIIHEGYAPPSRFFGNFTFHENYAPLGRYFINFTSSLVRAKLQGFDISLLSAIFRVECLILSANDTSLQNIIRDSALPIFKNLKTLKLLIGNRWASLPADWKVLPNLLDSSPNLQVLIFPEGLVRLTFIDEEFSHFNWQRPESVPECLSMHLKTIEIFQFVGFPEELQLVEYFLEFGKVLEKMVIHGYVSEDPLVKKKVEGDTAISELLSLRRSCSPSEVMSFKRSSSACQVIFTD